MKEILIEFADFLERHVHILEYVSVYVFWCMRTKHKCVLNKLSMVYGIILVVTYIEIKAFSKLQ